MPIYFRNFTKTYTHTSLAFDSISYCTKKKKHKVSAQHQDSKLQKLETHRMDREATGVTKYRIFLVRMYENDLVIYAFL